MTGLFVKDWALMGRQLRILVVYILVFTAIFSFTMQDGNFLTGFITVISVMMTINCFAYDEQCNFDKLVAASPIPRSRIVVARYLVAMAMGGAGGLMIMLVDMAARMIQGSGGEGLLVSLLTFIASFGTAVLLISILFPLFYRFGVNKSRLIMLLICGIPAVGAALIGWLAQKGVFPAVSLPDSFLRSLPLFIAAIILLGLWLSVSVSIRIYQRKEF